MMRDTRGGKVCSFSLAVARKRSGESQTMWLDCSLWGERGEKLCQYLLRGSSVACLGDFWLEECDGKSYPKLTVHDLQFLGSRDRGHSAQPTQQSGLPL